MNPMIARYQAAQKKLTDEEGRAFSGHFDDSARESRRAIVVVHDFFGLTPRIRSVATRLAGDGFVTFAPDLYRGAVARTPDEATTLARSLAWNQVATELGLAIGTLKRLRPGTRVGVVGFAMGGAAALVAAAAVAGLEAAVTYYGIPQDVVIDNPDVRVLGHFASRDPRCSPERVAALESALADRGTHRHAIHRYDADHGFADISRPDVHLEAAANLAWERTTAFLNEALR